MNASTLRVVPPHNTPVALSRAWERECQIVPNRGQTLFPETSGDRVYYEIAISGMIRFSYRTYEHCGWREITVRAFADALYETTNYEHKDTGVFGERHRWLRINGESIQTDQIHDKNGMHDRYGLKADRNDHMYRLRLENAGAVLAIACEANEGHSESFRSSGSFTVSVAAWVEDKAERKQETAIIAPRAVVLPPVPALPPSKPILTADQVRERKVWHQQRDLLDRVELVKARVALEMNLEAYVAEKYAHLDDDRRQGILQRMLDQIEGDEHDGKTL